MGEEWGRGRWPKVPRIFHWPGCTAHLKPSWPNVTLRARSPRSYGKQENLNSVAKIHFQTSSVDGICPSARTSSTNSDNWALSIFARTVAIFDFKRRGKMGRVVNAINEACISLSRGRFSPPPPPKPGKSALGTRLLLPLTRPSNHLNVKYLGLNNLCSEYENILYTIVMFPEQDFSPQNTCTLSGYLESLHAVASHHPFCSWVFKLYRITCYCCRCLYYCTCSFRKKKPTFFWQQNEEWCSHHDQYWSSTWAGDQRLLSKAS